MDKNKSAISTQGHKWCIKLEEKYARQFSVLMVNVSAFGQLRLVRDKLRKKTKTKKNFRSSRTIAYKHLELHKNVMLIPVI